MEKSLIQKSDLVLIEDLTQLEDITIEQAINA
jgi:hypothetical protein